MNKLRKLGFTLVELLIVIAIIGILASVILASLGDARDQGIGAKIKTEMDGIAKRVEIERTQNYTYDIACGSNGIPTSTKVMELISSINSIASSTLTCNSDTTEFAISTAIEGIHWCVDSTGIKKEIPDALTSGQNACP